MLDFDSGEDYQIQFQRLYEQRKKDLKKPNSLIKRLVELGLSDILSDSDEEENSLCTSAVAQTLNIPHSQVYYQASTNPVMFTKMVEKARRQIRRKKAKGRTAPKEILSTTQSLSGDESESKSKRKYEEELQSGELNKRQVQMIRNRISAQNSRDRKKVYIQRLEQDQQKLTEENQRLQKQLEQKSLQLEVLRKQIVALTKSNNQSICADCHSKNVMMDVDFYESRPSISRPLQKYTDEEELPYLPLVSLNSLDLSIKSQL